MTASLLFDLDGTIVETDPLHLKAFNSVFTPYGVTVDWETYKARIIGRNNPEIAAEFLPGVPQTEHAAIMASKETAYREQISSLEAASGLLALLDWADGNGIPCGVVTNAPRVNADAVLDLLALRHRFKVLVIGPELRDAKPHPLPYLTALDALGGEAERSVAFEDSITGITSAAAAGLGVVGITTSFDAARLQAAGAHVTAADFRPEAVMGFIRQRTGF
jgi:HAD superfamily hydrolase (TIGR01509 family)